MVSVALAPAVVWSTPGQGRGVPFGVRSSPAGHKCEHQRFPPRVRPDLHSQRHTSEIRHAEPVTVHIFATPQQSYGILDGTNQNYSSDIIGVLPGRRERAQAQLHDSRYAKSLATLYSLVLMQSLRASWSICTLPAFVAHAICSASNSHLVWAFSSDCGVEAVVAKSYRSSGAFRTVRGGRPLDFSLRGQNVLVVGDNLCVGDSVECSV